MKSKKFKQSKALKEPKSNLKPKLGNTRVTGREQYYTPPEMAESILRRVLKELKDYPNRIFLEPAGGTGTFIDAAKKLGMEKIVSYDIEPKHPSVELGSFLEQEFEWRGGVCVTNPPFGRNNSLSIPFFNHAANFCDLIAFIVPRSWRKWSVLNRLNLEFRLIDDWDLNIDYHDDKGRESHGIGNLRTCVQVWKREPDSLREIVAIPDHGLIEKTSPLEADVSFTLFGYGCGTVKTDFERIPNSTQTFFKLRHPRALEALQSVDFSLFYKHTAYTEALGLNEINYLLNKYLGLEQMPYSIDPSSEHYLGLKHSQKDTLGYQPRIL